MRSRDTSEKAITSKNWLSMKRGSIGMGRERWMTDNLMVTEGLLTPRPVVTRATGSKTIPLRHSSAIWNRLKETKTQTLLRWQEGSERKMWQDIRYSTTEDQLQELQSPVMRLWHFLHSQMGSGYGRIFSKLDHA